MNPTHVTQNELNSGANPVASSGLAEQPSLEIVAADACAREDLGPPSNRILKAD